MCIGRCLYSCNTCSINQMTVPARYPDNSFKRDTLAASSSTNSSRPVPLIDFLLWRYIYARFRLAAFSIHSKQKWINSRISLWHVIWCWISVSIARQHASANFLGRRRGIATFIFSRCWQARGRLYYNLTRPQWSLIIWLTIFAFILFFRDIHVGIWKPILGELFAQP